MCFPIKINSCTLPDYFQISIIPLFCSKDLAKPENRVFYFLRLKKIRQRAIAYKNASLLLSLLLSLIKCIQLYDSFYLPVIHAVGQHDNQKELGLF